MGELHPPGKVAAREFSVIFVSGMELSHEHYEELRLARLLLEKPSLAVRLTDALGMPLEKGFDLLPERWSETIHEAVRTSLNKALEVAVRSLEIRPSGRARDRLHRVAAIASGATGGAFGLAGLVVELPVSTTIMLRSIADIARGEGEDIAQVNAQLACLQVFALGGRSPADDAAETGYFAVRSAMAKSVTEAARHLAQKGVSDRGAPALVRLISTIGSRFGIVVSQKAAAMAVPALGAAGGALVNSLFIRHFQDVAHGHFIIRRLEREYNPDTIRAVYAQLSREEQSGS